METPLASFQLLKFIIPEFTFSQVDEKFNSVDIQLIPSGSYNTSNGEYNLVLTFVADAKNEKNVDERKVLLNGILKAFYKFDERLPDDIVPDFFYQNSLAIVFPYLRAFVSNITLQAGSPLLVLPLLNLTSLSATLKENTIVFK